MTTDINSQVENVAGLINEMVSLTAESGSHAQTSSTDLESLVKTSKTMSELSNDVENILTEFAGIFVNFINILTGKSNFFKSNLYKFDCLFY